MGNAISVNFDSLVNKVCDGLQSFAWELGVKHVTYVNQLEDNLEDLQKAVEDLRALKREVTRKVNLAQQQQKQQKTQMSENVEVWLLRVDATAEKGDELSREGEQQVQRLCLGGVCSTNYVSSSMFGGKVVKCIKDLADLLTTGRGFTELVVEAPAEQDLGAERPCGLTVGTETKLQMVLHLVDKEEIGMVGVYGTVGVGKTTLLTLINNHFVRRSKVIVIWIDVPNDFTLESIQQGIAEKIGLPDELKNSSLEQKATYISKVLQEKKILLLLDDIREQVDLTKIGVPPTQSLKGSKVVFTTRLQEVCKQMSLQPNSIVSIETLEEEQAWGLFLTTVGKDTVSSHPKILSLSKMVSRKCGGLPLALTIIGKAMSGKREPKQWERAIKTFERPSLQHPKDREDQRAMSELFSFLRCIYDNLPSEKVKSCFLYCALFTGGFGIPKMQLVEILSFEDSCINFDTDDYDEIDAKKEEAYCILNDLVRASLLEDKGEWVTMSDPIRSMALWISKEDVMVMDGKQLKEEPKIGRWEGMKRVSLMQTNIEELSQVPACPDLVTLLLSHNSRLHDICNGFFKPMGKLNVLDLSCSGVKVLPESLSSLVCLKYLNISYTKIQKLPTELMKLKQLKYFDVSGLDLKLERSKKVICQLSSLQLLKILCDYCYDEGAGRNEGATSKTSVSDDEILLEELQLLKHLKVLEITLESPSALKKLVNTHRLVRSAQCLELVNFKDPEGIDVSMLGKMEHLEELLISHCNFKQLGANPVSCRDLHRSASFTDRSFINSIHRVVVKYCHYLQDITCLALMPNLRMLVVLNCLALREIISGEKLSEVVANSENLHPFSNLALLHLSDLPKLEHICPTSTLSLQFLYQLQVVRCPLLKKLPFGSKNARPCQIKLTVDEEWWNEIEWEDDATKAALLPCFNKRSPTATGFK